MSKFFGRVGLGLLISIPITTIIVGSIEDACGMFLLSIICTAGIGLVFWIPVWWITGWLTLVLLSAAVDIFAPDSSQGRQLSTPHEGTSTAYQALCAYICRAMASGMEVDEMRHRLQQHGWPPADIETAYQECIAYTAKTQES